MVDPRSIADRIAAKQKLRERREELSIELASVESELKDLGYGGLDVEGERMIEAMDDPEVWANHRARLGKVWHWLGVRADLKAQLEEEDDEVEAFRTAFHDSVTRWVPSPEVEVGGSGTQPAPEATLGTQELIGFARKTLGPRKATKSVDVSRSRSAGVLKLRSKTPSPSKAQSTPGERPSTPVGLGDTCQRWRVCDACAKRDEVCLVRRDKRQQWTEACVRCHERRVSCTDRGVPVSKAQSQVQPQVDPPSKGKRKAVEEVEVDTERKRPKTREFSLFSFLNRLILLQVVQ